MLSVLSGVNGCSKSVNANQAVAKINTLPTSPTSLCSKVIMKSNSLRLVGKSASAALVLVSLTLSGCTKSASSAADSSIASSDSAAKTGPKTSAAVSIAPELPGVKVQPGTASDGFDGARSDVSGLSCKADGKGAWNVSGTVKNSTDTAVNYRIYTSFLHGTETLGLVETDLENVKANDTKKWSGSMTINVDKVDCVLRVERVKR